VGILGDIVLPVLRLDLSKLPDQPKVRDAEVKEIDIDHSTAYRFGEKYVFLAAQAAIAQTALSWRDYNRMDFREDSDGKIYFLEANPLPGLNPTTSDFPKMARLAGLSHEVTVNTVLLEAIKRYRNNNYFSERFSDARIDYLREFVSPVEHLGFFTATIPSKGTESGAYRLAKVKK